MTCYLSKLEFESNENISFENKKIFEIFKPGYKFPAISISGINCELSCAHCGGHYLKHMQIADSPAQLLDICINLSKKKAKGVLISGGCNQNGYVMLDNYIKTFTEIKQKTDLILNVHTGLVTKQQAKEIAHSDIDVVSCDLVGDSGTIKKVFGLPHSPLDYQNSIMVLKEAGIKKVVPHICLGLDYGEIIGEYNAIDIVSKIKASELIFIVLIPTSGTKMAKIEPPKINRIIEIMRYAKSTLTHTKLFLGCMRPRLHRFRKYNIELELAVIKAGIDGIVLPSKSTYNWLMNNMFKCRIHDTCFSVL